LPNGKIGSDIVQQKKAADGDQNHGPG